MRRLLQDIAAGRALGDATLADPAAVSRLADSYDSQRARGFRYGSG
jgi:hypothetical protein